MTRSIRVLVGSFGMLIFLAAYIWLATKIADALPPRPWAWLIYYPVVGTAWGLPLIPLLSWINKAH